MAISPSAIEKFAASDSGCQRRYFWAYVLKDWEPQTDPGPSTQAGKLTHSLLENFHKHGTAIDPTAEFVGPAWHDGKVYRFGEDHPKWGEKWQQVSFTFRIGELALKLLEQTPVHSSGLSEHKFRATVEGIEFSGVVDYLTPVYITDYKTTGSSLEYAATPRKLLNDTQRLVYSAAFPDRRYSRWVTGEWIDLAIQPAERENVPEDKERFKLHVLAPAEKMLALGQNPGLDPLSLPLPGKQDKYTGLTKACNAFGKPCPRISRCFPKKRLKLSLPAMSASVDSPKKSPNEDFVLAGSGDAKLLSDAAACPLVTDKSEEKTMTETRPKYLIENLYIDCMPIVAYPPGEALEYSYEYIAAAGAEVSSDMGVASPMLVDFGKGPHLVTAQLIANLSDRSEPIKHLFLETRSAEGRACMQELTSRSKFVVKGCY